ncbi:MAG: bifunctional (p)ppGpp synthetase/guanosine-3',5'-bis(diphosphate) 3'-pyrophosphohydrolase [Bacteroides sp.]|nr:bifunctional (p)ppGpp synthetase/guanosine-3',5'-bis(diphosphate) 3'-pyrophosphohydrolase [Eubacterium sp.]MCM1419058.1 bifunctional (p)ppGpp synthetase/guanosine-3',5'-bis(diphosphate) 3'-pyrophosphohydrolase [Roseburia sp.]MCM1461755.1 bifunctional (p)ppGpp synthetase/guanosine-3',5'-bis(diphosphate) 3'-pyrophosphohydrolase [Bacteroides sp.]
MTNETPGAAERKKEAMLYTIDVLIDKIKATEKQYDLDKIIAAYEFADEAHAGVKRSSGEPYITHPIAVACILLEYCMDTDTICAALLHDVVEDTDTTLETISRKFSPEVANLVDGVTKIGQVPLNTKEEQQAENIRKILIAMSKDIRVIIIKLADRLHNMRTIMFRPPEKQRKKALENMNFYAPIAHRLGMSAVKEEMEDISIKILDPYGVKTIEELLSRNKEERSSFIDVIRERIGERISDIVPPPIIEGRVKSVYSIYKKLYIKGKSFDEIYDVYAVRVIVRSVIQCYNVLGIIHDMFKPIPYRFKDYIATPKPNRYQSLHTTVIGREGIPFEVQIRTVDMHNTAQYGIAAHWKYKAGITGTSAGEKRFDWIRQILEQQQEGDDVEQIADAIKVDLAPDDVYVFTPKGDVITLPLGSTVIDFAYAIHTQVGNKMTGAKVGGRMVRFDYELKTGNIVEILTTSSPSYGPNRNWLEIAKTGEARGKIRAWFKRECREENIAEGLAALEAEFHRANIVPTVEFLKDIAASQRFDNVDDFYAAIGYGGVKLSKIMQRIKDLYNRSRDDAAPAPDGEDVLNRTIEQKQRSGVIVEGIDNCLIKFAKCCNPLPGDRIIGFITRGYGVSVHKQDCVNVVNADPQEKERWINVMWAAPGASVYYSATIDIITDNISSALADVTAVITGGRFPMRHVSANQLKNGNGNIVVTVEVASAEQLGALIGKIRKVPGVISAERTQVQ